MKRHESGLGDALVTSEVLLGTGPPAGRPTRFPLQKRHVGLIPSSPKLAESPPQPDHPPQKPLFVQPFSVMPILQVDTGKLVIDPMP